MAVVRRVHLDARGLHRRRRSDRRPGSPQARAKNGKTMHMQNAWIYEFSDGKLTRGRVSVDTAVLRDTVEGITPPA
jgi:ketosteroid isomerase-like protein